MHVDCDKTDAISKSFEAQGAVVDNISFLELDKAAERCDKRPRHAAQVIPDEVFSTRSKPAPGGCFQVCVHRGVARREDAMPCNA